MIALLAILGCLSAAAPPAVAADGHLPDLTPPEPISEFAHDPLAPEMTLDFCSQWNPEFAHNGGHCCAKVPVTRKERRANRCAPNRRSGLYCSEMTEEEKAYTARIKQGQADGSIPDVLDLLKLEMGRAGQQAYCSVNLGFLAHGRRLIPTKTNRIQMSQPDRCVDFGTDAMIAMLETLGHKVGEKYSGPDYSGVHLIVGDIAPPRGGCLSAKSGRRGHASHTTGLDADIGFLWAKPHRQSPNALIRDFDVPQNWWMIKQIFANPYACVKVLFLDKRLIRKLGKSREVTGDPEWAHLRSHIHHVPGHRNHMHVRLGLHPGAPGCSEADSTPDEDDEDSEEESEGDYFF